MCHNQSTRGPSKLTIETFTLDTLDFSGHATVVTLPWTHYSVTLQWEHYCGHSIMVKLQWSHNHGHTIVVTLPWTRYSGHATVVTHRHTIVVILP